MLEDNAGENLGETVIEYRLFHGITQTWFLRSSWTFKFKTLYRMLTSIKSMESLACILNTLYSISGKSMVYTQMLYCPQSIFDKPLFDHDRSMEPLTLRKAQDDAITWFGQLDEEQQFTVFTGMLRLAGGYLIRLLYSEALNLYKSRLEEMSLGTNPFTAKTHSFKSVDMTSWTNLHRTPFRSVDDKPVRKSYDDLDPLSIEVARLEKLFEESLKKYESEVEVKIKKNRPKAPKKRKKSPQGKKDKKGKSKGGRSTTKSKTTKSKKGKKGKKGDKLKKLFGKGNESLDQLQLLPIWVMKKILWYLDKKTLNKVREVNAYWDYVIDEVIEEKKVQNQIHKYKVKLQRELDQLMAEYGKPIEKPPQTDFYRLTKEEKRMVKLFQRGAILPSLRPNFNTELSIFDYDLYTMQSDKPGKFQHRSFPQVQVRKQDQVPLMPKRDVVMHSIYYDGNETAREKLEFLEAHGNKFKEDFICKTDEDDE